MNAPLPKVSLAYAMIPLNRDDFLVFLVFFGFLGARSGQCERVASGGVGVLMISWGVA